MIEFINSEEFFNLSQREKSLIGQQRSGMEVYLNALTNRIYCEDTFSFDISSAIWPMFLGSVLGNSSWGNLPSKDIEDLKKTVEESDTVESDNRAKETSDE